LGVPNKKQPKDPSPEVANVWALARLKLDDIVVPWKMLQKFGGAPPSDGPGFP